MLHNLSTHDGVNPNGSQKATQLTRSRRPKPHERTPAKSKRAQIASVGLPKKTLEDTLKVPGAIKDNYGTTGATWEQIASALETSANTVNSKYLLWSAVAYGIITKEGNIYNVSETGRKILAPTYEGEDREGMIKAIATPSILARFYSDYNSSPLPQGDIFSNVLEQKYGIPKNRVDET